MNFEDMINTIQLGDCYEIIKHIPDKTVDCVYIDIPYLIKNIHAGSGLLKSEKRKQTYFKELNKICQGVDNSIYDELCRIMKKINIFIWCSKEQIVDILNYFVKEQGCIFEILVWCKTNPTPFCNNTWLPNIEYCLYFKESGVPLNDGYELKSKFYVNSSNINDKEQFKHPTIKPLELVKRHLLHATQPNDIVLDCFCGSGTTCVASKEAGRRFIGIEIDPNYHKIAVNRLNGINANGQCSIFTDFELLEENNKQ